MLTLTQKAAMWQFFKAVFSTISYTVDSSVIEGDTAKVTVTLTAPDFESINLYEYIDEEQLEAAALEALAANGYTLEDIAAADEAEMEIMADIVFNAERDYLVNGLLEAVKNADIVSETSVIELVFTDGRWLVTNEADIEEAIVTVYDENGNAYEIPESDVDFYLENGFTLGE